MDNSLAQMIEQCAKSAHAGTFSFGDAVGILMSLGVESYYADYRLLTVTYYLHNDATYTFKLQPPDTKIAQAFDVQALQAAIRGAQRGEVNYPQFIKLAMAAGCVSYSVWIAGRHVSYFGRRGEMHIEPFPDKSSDHRA